MIYFQNMFLFELTGAHNVFVIEILWFVHKCNNLIIFMAFLLETFSVDEQYLDAVTVKKKNHVYRTTLRQNWLHVKLFSTKSRRGEGGAVYHTILFKMPSYGSKFFWEKQN